MFEGLNCIKLSGEEYPIKCDMVVLEQLQEEFGSVADFENRLIPWEAMLDERGEEIKGENGKTIYKGKIPDIKATNAALYYMVNEGEEIAAEKGNREPRRISRKQILRCADLPPTVIADQLHEEFKRCFRIKNGKTTQNQTETGTKEDNG